MTVGDERYASYLALPGFGRSAMFTLGVSRVQVVGLGAIGSAAATALVRSGAGVIALDDGADATDRDAAHGLCPLGSSGQLRAQAARRELLAIRAGVRVEPFATTLRPTVVVVCSDEPGLAGEAAEAARLARRSHVVAQPHPGGGHVVTVPVGGPCYACAAAASPPGTSGEASSPGGTLDPGRALALGGLAAAEALLLLAAYAREPRARCILLGAEGLASRATTRRPGCACGGR